jgi:AAA15 family ATPase/GTPase
MEFNLPENALNPNKQKFQLDKIATLIGENGSGKSTILKTIFDEKLANATFTNQKIVCFSLGQNERYSKSFSQYLAAERQANRSLSLNCFYYDKQWSKLLIFIATTTKPAGLVRQFLKDKNYIAIADSFDGDKTTTLNLKVKVDQAYVNRVKIAIEDEENGNMETLRTSAYHRSLESFIDTLIHAEYEFDMPITPKTFSLTADKLQAVSFEEDIDSSFDPLITFFTQAADNDYFIEKIR